MINAIKFSIEETEASDQYFDHTGYDQKDAFPEALITLPGKSYAEYALVEACAKLLLAPPKSAELK